MQRALQQACKCNCSLLTAQPASVLWCQPFCAPLAKYAGTALANCTDSGSGCDVVPGYPCRYIVLMSDGIFEFMDSQQVMAEVHAAAQAGQAPSEVAKKLVKMARQ